MKMELDADDVRKIAEAVAQTLAPFLAQTQARSPEDDFFDVPSLAAHLKVDASWIYQQVHARTIPFYKVGKYVRFKRSEISTWVEQNKTKKSAKRQ